MDGAAPSGREQDGERGRVAPREERRISDDFKVQVGRLAILWGDIEALTRTLELMRVQGPRYRAKTDVELQREYRPQRRRFDKRLKVVLPHRTAMARGILTLKDVRDFCLHGAVIQWGDAREQADAIVHADLPATMFAQGGFLSRPLQTIVPRAGMLRNAKGELEPAIMTTDGLRRAGDKLAGYVYDLRLFRTLLQVKEGEEIRFQVERRAKRQGQRSDPGAKAEQAPRSPRSIDSSVFQNPADEIGHDPGTAVRVGEFFHTFALLDQTIRTLELMRGSRPGDFRAHRNPKAAAWYGESGRQLTGRLNFILGKESRGARGLSELVKFRNFVLHNPISLLGSGAGGWRAAFVHRDLVALRDARQRPDAEKNAVRPVPDWALARHAGTTHVLVDRLAERTRAGDRLARAAHRARGAGPCEERRPAGLGPGRWAQGLAAWRTTDLIQWTGTAGRRSWRI